MRPAETPKRPTQILASEHRVIETVLVCLEAMARTARAAGKLDREPALLALEFFRTFADRCHHGKEEAILFPAFEAAGYPREGGPTGVMIEEHVRGRALVRAMAESVEGAARGEPAALRAFAESATRYVELLRQHIRKEDACLFPMAEGALGPEEERRVAEAFERVESEEMGTGTHERMLAVAEGLARRFGAALPAGHGAGGCGCGGAHRP